MFNFLLKATAEQVVGGIHYAIRIIKNRTDSQFIRKAREINGVSAELSEDDRRLALRIIGAIEKVVRAKLERLSEAKAKKYVKELVQVVEKLTRREFDYNRARGRAFLRELRKSPLRYYPGPSEEPIEDLFAAQRRDLVSRLVEIIDEGGPMSLHRAYHVLDESVGLHEIGDEFLLILGDAAGEARQLGLIRKMEGKGLFQRWELTALAQPWIKDRSWIKQKIVRRNWQKA